MGIFEPPNPKLYYIEAAEKPVQAVCFTLSSLLVSLLYICFLDFAQSYFVSPKDFPKRGCGQTFFKPKVDAPLVEAKPGSEDMEEVLKQGSEQSSDKVYRMEHHSYERVIVPYKMIDEIRNIPKSKLSFQQGSYDIFMGWHTGVTNHERAVANVLKMAANKVNDVVYRTVQDESYRTVLEKVGDCLDWTTVRLLPQTITMIMAISQRVFVGEPLCRNEEWLQSIYKVTQNAFGSVQSRVHRAKAKKLLAPVLEKRLRDMEDPEWQPTPDLMQFVRDATTKTGEGRSLEYQGDAIIGTGRAAFFTTGLTIYQLVYDLAVHPEYIEPLRQEILDLGDFPFTRANMNKLSKLDFFIRESQSWRKNMQVGTFRKVLDDLTLPYGTLLPAGTYLGTNLQNAVFDDSGLANPCEFDGFRFDRLRSVPDQEQTDQSVQTSADHLDYGTKNQSCVLISLNRIYSEKQFTLICNL